MHISESTHWFITTVKISTANKHDMHDRRIKNHQIINCSLGTQVLKYNQLPN